MTTRKKPPKYCGPHKHSGKAYAWFNGRQIYFSGKYNSPESLRDYQKFLVKVVGTVEKHVEAATLADVFAAWLDENAEKVSAKNLNHYQSCMRKLLDLGYAELLVDEFGPRKLKKFRSHLVSEGYAQSTINQQVGRVKKVFKWAVSEELATPSLVQALYSVDGLRAGETEAPPPKRRRPANWSRVEELDGLLSDTLARMCKLHWLTGMRSGNLCKLTLSQVDRSGSVWVYRPEEHKNMWRGKGLAIPLGPQCQEVIYRSLSDRGVDSPVFRPVDSVAWHRENNPKFVEWRSRVAGDYFTPNTYRQAVLRAQAHKAGIAIGKKLPNTQEFRDAGWEPWTPYDLRNEAVTRIRMQFGIEAARAYMGHSTLQATEIYSEHDLESAKRISQKVG